MYINAFLQLLCDLESERTASSLSMKKMKSSLEGSDAFRFWRALKAGQVRIGILKLLMEGDLHGYGIMKRISDRTGGLISPTAGTVYPILQDLLRRGHVDGRWVSSEGSRKKRLYHITKKGSDTLSSLERLRLQSKKQIRESLFKASKLLELDEGSLPRLNPASGMGGFGPGAFGGFFDEGFEGRPTSERLKMLGEAQRRIQIRIRMLKQKERSLSKQIKSLRRESRS